MGKTRRTIGAAVATASAIALGFGLTVPAMAQTQPTTGPNYGDIQATRQGSITVYKHQNQTGTTVYGDPSKATDPIKSPAVKDVVFTAYPFTGLNLTGENANANWEKLSALSNGAGATKLAAACNGATPALEGFTFGEGQAFAATDDAGKATKSGLQVGAYLLCETSAPENVVSKAAPTVVTIPYPDNNRDGATNKWLYDVTIFPKNNVGGNITKTIEEQKPHGFGLGSEVRFPVTVPVPSIGADESFSEFIVADPMTDSRWSEQGVVDQSVKIGNTPLDKADYKVTDQGHTIYVGLTKSGLEKLKENAGSNVSVVFKGKVTSVGNGTIDNVAQYWMKTDKGTTPPPNPPTVPPTPTTPPTGTTPPPTGTSPKVSTHWGNAKLHKVDAGNREVGLSGAKFKVFEAKDPYPTNGTCTAEKADNAQAITVNKQDTFVSDEQGLVTIAGLFVSDSEHPQKDATQRCYVVEEIAAPAGYVLPSGKEALHAVAVKTGETAANEYDATIENTKSTVPNLPLTGGNGAVLLGAIGGALVLVGGGSYVVYRRRRAA